MPGREDIDAANPATGEVLDRLDEQPAEKLAEALDEITGRMIEYKRWQTAVETELRRRLRLVNRNQYVWGGWEIVKTRSRKSEWDVDELRQVIESLVDEGTIKAAEAVDVIVQPPAEVKRENAKRLAASLNGAARKAVEACCTWKEERGKLTVHKTVELTEGGTVEGSAVEDETSMPLVTPALPPVTPPPGPSDPAREAREYEQAHGETNSQTGEAPSQPDTATEAARPATNNPQELFA